MNAMTLETTTSAETPAYSTDEERWQAIQRRDATADGIFWTGVLTTGVYCRPSCTARHALRKNVRFYDSIPEAKRDGLRACKRCRPDEAPLAERQAESIAKACRFIEESTEMPSLEELAKAAGMSRFYFHRLFKSQTGVTPREYAAGPRAERMRRELSQQSRVTDAIYAAGFSSSGPFYAASDKTLGMTPTRYREGGAGMTIRFAIGETSLGSILVAATEKGICNIALGDDPEALISHLQGLFPQAELVGGDAGFERWVAAVVALVEAPELGLELPLDIRGTSFQQRVWRALTQIPAGSTATYSEIAAKIGAPKAVRAVAHACATNKLAVAIPCHRVVRRDGDLGGYRWGIQRKSELLQRESSR